MLGAPDVFLGENFRAGCLDSMIEVLPDSWQSTKRACKVHTATARGEKLSSNNNLRSLDAPSGQQSCSQNAPLVLPSSTQSQTQSYNASAC